MRIGSSILIAISFSSCDALNTLSETNAGPSGPKAYRFVPIAESAKRRCTALSSASVCGSLAQNAVSAKCMVLIGGGLNADPCSIRVSDTCWVFQETGERCYEDITECQRPEKGTCNFYSDCLEKMNKCGADGYPLKYAQKYCYAFRSLQQQLSDAGKRWRDGTMHCLQNSLVNFVDGKKHSCDKIQSDAFEDHVDCYTSKDNSICDLPLSDIVQIVEVVEKKEFVRRSSITQMIKVAKICLGEKISGAAHDRNFFANLQAQRDDKALFWQKKLKEWQELVDTKKDGSDDDPK